MKIKNDVTVKIYLIYERALDKMSRERVTLAFYLFVGIEHYFALTMMRDMYDIEDHPRRWDRNLNRIASANSFKPSQEIKPQKRGK